MPKKQHLVHHLPGVGAAHYEDACRGAHDTGPVSHAGRDEDAFVAAAARLAREVAQRETGEAGYIWERYRDAMNAPRDASADRPSGWALVSSTSRSFGRYERSRGAFKATWPAPGGAWVAAESARWLEAEIWGAVGCAEGLLPLPHTVEVTLCTQPRRHGYPGSASPPPLRVTTDAMLPPIANAGSSDATKPRPSLEALAALLPEDARRCIASASTRVYLASDGVWYVHRTDPATVPLPLLRTAAICSAEVIVADYIAHREADAEAWAVAAQPAAGGDNDDDASSSDDDDEAGRRRQPTYPPLADYANRFLGVVLRAKKAWAKEAPPLAHAASNDSVWACLTRVATTHLGLDPQRFTVEAFARDIAGDFHGFIRELCTLLGCKMKGGSLVWDDADVGEDYSEVSASGAALLEVSPRPATGQYVTPEGEFCTVVYHARTHPTDTPPVATNNTTPPFAGGSGGGGGGAAVAIKNLALVAGGGMSFTDAVRHGIAARGAGVPSGVKLAVLRAKLRCAADVDDAGCWCDVARHIAGTPAVVFQETLPQAVSPTPEGDTTARTLASTGGSISNLGTPRSEHAAVSGCGSPVSSPRNAGGTGGGGMRNQNHGVSWILEKVGGAGDAAAPAGPSLSSSTLAPAPVAEGVGLVDLADLSTVIAALVNEKLRGVVDTGPGGNVLLHPLVTLWRAAVPDAPEALAAVVRLHREMVNPDDDVTRQLATDITHLYVAQRRFAEAKAYLLQEQALHPRRAPSDQPYLQHAFGYLFYHFGMHLKRHSAHKVTQATKGGLPPNARVAFERAVESLQHVVEAAAETDDAARMKALALANLASCYAELGEREKAHAALETAGAAAGAAEDPEITALVEENQSALRKRPDRSRTVAAKVIQRSYRIVMWRRKARLPRAMLARIGRGFLARCAVHRHHAARAAGRRLQRIARGAAVRRMCAATLMPPRVRAAKFLQRVARGRFARQVVCSMARARAAGEEGEDPSTRAAKENERSRKASGEDDDDDAATFSGASSSSGETVTDTSSGDGSTGTSSELSSTTDEEDVVNDARARPKVEAAPVDLPPLTDAQQRALGNIQRFGRGWFHRRYMVFLGEQAVQYNALVTIQRWGRGWFHRRYMVYLLTTQTRVEVSSSSGAVRAAARRGSSLSHESSSSSGDEESTDDSSTSGASSSDDGVLSQSGEARDAQEERAARADRVSSPRWEREPQSRGSPPSESAAATPPPTAAAGTDGVDTHRTDAPKHGERGAAPADPPAADSTPAPTATVLSPVQSTAFESLAGPDHMELDPAANPGRATAQISGGSGFSDYAESDGADGVGINEAAAFAAAVSTLQRGGRGCLSRRGLVVVWWERRRETHGEADQERTAADEIEEVAVAGTAEAEAEADAPSPTVAARPQGAAGDTDCTGSTVDAPHEDAPRQALAEDDPCSAGGGDGDAPEAPPASADEASQEHGGIASTLDDGGPDPAAGSATAANPRAASAGGKSKNAAAGAKGKKRRSSSAKKQQRIASAPATSGRATPTPTPPETLEGSQSQSRASRSGAGTPFTDEDGGSGAASSSGTAASGGRRTPSPMGSNRRGTREARRRRVSQKEKVRAPDDAEGPGGDVDEDAGAGCDTKSAGSGTRVSIQSKGGGKKKKKKKKQQKEEEEEKPKQDAAANAMTAATEEDGDSSSDGVLSQSGEARSFAESQRRRSQILLPATPRHADDGSTHPPSVASSGAENSTREADAGVEGDAASPSGDTRAQPPAAARAPEDPFADVDLPRDEYAEQQKAQTGGGVGVTSPMPSAFESLKSGEAPEFALPDANPANAAGGAGIPAADDDDGFDHPDTEGDGVTLDAAERLRLAVGVVGRCGRGCLARAALAVRQCRRRRGVEDTAARKIQARQRGNAGRREAATRKAVQQAGARPDVRDANADEAERARAATKIQARHRGNAARAEAAARRAAVEEKAATEAAERSERERRAATKIQAVHRGNSGRARAAAEESRRTEEAAATKIQSRHRGNAGRVAAAARRAELEQEDRTTAAAPGTKEDASTHHVPNTESLVDDAAREKAATKIQAVHRGRTARAAAASKRSAKEQHEADVAAEHKAATRIQARQRGNAARAEVVAKRAEKEGTEPGGKDSDPTEADAEAAERERKHTAAAKIQARHRSNSARADVARKRVEAEADAARRRDAATKIQARHRGNTGRAEAAALRAAAVTAEAERPPAAEVSSGGKAHTDQEHHKAATKIQARHRGNAARAEAAQRRAEVDHAAAETKQEPEKKDDGEQASQVQNTRETEAATRIQARHRGNAARADAAARRAQQVDERRAQAHAATKIQARQRGNAARAEAAQRRAAKADREVAAATAIQARHRGNAARDVYKVRAAELRAAVLLQRAGRGRAGRVEVVVRAAARAKARRQQEVDAATVIQARQRGNAARAEVRKIRDERNAADALAGEAQQQEEGLRRQRDGEAKAAAAAAIQGLHRGNMARAEVIERIAVARAAAVAETAASTRLQAVARGAAARQGLFETREKARAGAQRLEPEEPRTQDTSAGDAEGGEADAAVGVEVDAAPGEQAKAQPPPQEPREEGAEEEVSDTRGEDPARSPRDDAADARTAGDASPSATDNGGAESGATSLPPSSSSEATAPTPRQGEEERVGTPDASGGRGVEPIAAAGCLQRIGRGAAARATLHADKLCRTVRSRKKRERQVGKSPSPTRRPRATPPTPPTTQRKPPGKHQRSGGAAAVPVCASTPSARAQTARGGRPRPEGEPQPQRPKSASSVGTAAEPQQRVGSRSASPPSVGWGGGDASPQNQRGRRSHPATAATAPPTETRAVVALDNSTGDDAAARTTEEIVAQLKLEGSSLWQQVRETRHQVDEQKKENASLDGKLKWVSRRLERAKEHKTALIRRNHALKTRCHETLGEGYLQSRIEVCAKEAARLRVANTKLKNAQRAVGGKLMHFNDAGSVVHKNQRHWAEDLRVLEKLLADLAEGRRADQARIERQEARILELQGVTETTMIEGGGGEASLAASDVTVNDIRKMEAMEEEMAFLGKVEQHELRKISILRKELASYRRSLEVSRAAAEQPEQTQLRLEIRAMRSRLYHNRARPKRDSMAVAGGGAAHAASASASGSPPASPVFSPTAGLPSRAEPRSPAPPATRPPGGATQRGIH